MKKVGFIGAIDKTNLILSIAKILTIKNKRTLIIDTTIEQKLKYIVPTVHPTKTYITTWEDIDVAVGFERLEQICEYAGIKQAEEEYDVILLNVDNAKAIEDMNIYENDVNFFVTAIDLYSIRKGLETFGNIKTNIKMTKIIFSIIMDDAEDEYINNEAENYRIEWDKYIFFPLILEDRYAEMANQLIYKIGFKEMSQMYKESLVHLISLMFKEEIKENDIRKIIKNFEKGGV